MAKRITFQFEDDLDYQIQAIHSTVELFRGLSRHVDGIYRPNRICKIGEGDPIRNNDIVAGSRLLQNLRGVQLSNDLFADNTLVDGNNFTIEMETGTGKTYVYLRTILELYQEYGFCKYMIVVPSIAIRKGVEKSMEQLADHFKRLYNIDIGKHSFIFMELAFRSAIKSKNIVASLIFLAQLFQLLIFRFILGDPVLYKINICSCYLRVYAVKKLKNVF